MNGQTLERGLQPVARDDVLHLNELEAPLRVPVQDVLALGLGTDRSTNLPSRLDELGDDVGREEARGTWKRRRADSAMVERVAAGRLTGDENCLSHALRCVTL